MSLRQREWAVFIRPYDERKIGGSNVKVPYTGTPKAMKGADLGYEITGIDTPKSLKGECEGMIDSGVEEEEDCGLECDSGGWVLYAKTSSFVELREILKLLLDTYGKEYTRVAEFIPLDTLVTPLT